MKFKLSALAAALIASGTAMAAEPTNQELLELIEKQEAQIKELKTAVKKSQKQVEQTVEAVESNMASSGSKTTIGGYGEVHYNNIEGAEEIDFHRFVLFAGYEFSDKIRFFSELEVEHSIAGDGKNGEVELEQAYIEMDLSNDTKLKSGLFLIPVGILNETHEPNTFYGVERNPVEKNIIPATWWEAGATINTQFSEGFSADFAIHSGLNTPLDGDKAFNIRSGRQKVSEAAAENFAYTARVKYTAVPGLELAATIQHQTDITQGELDASANLIEAHAVYNSGSFGLRALYASWDIDGDEAAAFGRDKQSGYYIEPSYKINENFGVFARFAAWDNTEGDALDSEKEQTNIGLNYWPHENVVFKFDLENRGGTQDGDGFNVGVGYQF
ncbi:porin [Aliikangiella sp. G2MR2-5]|uniref:porin n=1 Tax=Aliikangiella sp. G2MR2-5 TaxID=2788943 RepID=UPI0018A9A851|nr:porin [Aliikangiella sp. G2MR2-5]